MFENATFESFKREEEIFIEKDKPNDKCYVILSGKVGIYRGVMGCDIEIGDESLKQFGNAQGGGYPSFSDAVYQGENLRLLKNLAYYGDLLAKLTFGMLFGETGLLNDNPRNASIIAMEPTEMMVFHKKSLDLIKTFYSNEFTERKTLLTKLIPELSMINSQTRITQLLEFFKPQRYQNNDHLFREGQRDNKIFFLQEGEVLLTKIVPIPTIENNRKIVYKDEVMGVTTIQGTGIIGEECMDDESPYKYSAIVKSHELKVYVFEKSSNFSDFQSFPLFALLLKGYHFKE